MVTCVDNTPVNEDGQRTHIRDKVNQESPSVFHTPSYIRYVLVPLGIGANGGGGPKTRGREQYAGGEGGKRKGEHAETNGGNKERREGPDLPNIQAEMREEGAEKWQRGWESGDGGTESE